MEGEGRKGRERLGNGEGGEGQVRGEVRKGRGSGEEEERE
jgi:hypothetical protein